MGYINADIVPVEYKGHLFKRSKRVGSPAEWFIWSIATGEYVGAEPSRTMAKRRIDRISDRKGSNNA